MSLTEQTENAASNGMYISFVAPAFNESPNLVKLVEEVAKVAATIGKNWECVIADDCSTDDSLAVLGKLRKTYPQLVIIELDRRSGQTAAMEACFRAAAGKYIATMDGDLQNDPAEIPRMLEFITSGQCDMVNGWRKTRRDNILRLLSTKLGNAVRNWLTRENIQDGGCGLKVYRREVVESFKLFNGLHRFFPTLAKMNGFKVIETPVNHRHRVAGVAKYGVWNRLFKVLRDAMAIRWMQNRNLKYTAKRIDGPVGPA